MQFDILKQARKARKETLTVLAKDMGVSRELMGRYENGDSVPRVDFVEAWCKRYEFEVRILAK